MNRSTIASVGVFVVGLWLLASPTGASAQGRGRGQGQGKGKVSEATTRSGKARDEKARDAKPRNAQPVFGSHDREIITNYYAGLPPGLAKRGGDLPPGLEKQLRRNGTLPPGLQKRLRPLPPALERQLGALPRGYRRGILDDHLLVYRSDNYSIADFFRNR